MGPKGDGAHAHRGVPAIRPDSMMRRMLSMVDLYRILQVAPDAEADVIRSAFRALARKYHPDLGGSDGQMALLNEAWRVLGNPRERAQYDRHRAHPPAASPPAPDPSSPPHWPPGPTTLDFGHYAGWSLAELATRDPDYLEWLARTSIGRRLQPEIEKLLAARRRGARMDGPAFRVAHGNR